MRLTPPRRRYVFAIALLLPACNAPRGGQSPASIDTLPGGVIHVVNHDPAEWRDSSRWKLELERRMLSADSGAAMFNSPRNVVATSTGEIAVLDRRPASLKLFSASGVFLRTIGRQGAGPGEYADHGDLRIVGDTLVVNDRGNSRMVLFTLDGKHLRTFPVDRGAATGPATSDGRIGVSEYLAHRPPTPADNYPGEGVRRYRLDGTVADSFFYPPEPRPRVWSLVDATHDLGDFIPFLPGLVRTIDYQGRLIWGHQDGYRLIVSRTGLDTAMIIESTAPQVAISDSLRRAEFADVLKGSPWAVGIAKLEDIPLNYPAWTEMASDPQGNLWVLRPGTNGPGSTFDVFSPAGVLRGRIAAPFGTLDYSSFTNDRIYRIGETSDGQPCVEVWRIVKGR